MFLKFKFVFFVTFVCAFRIQERSTLKFIHNFGEGVIAMVDTPEEATNYAIKQSKRNLNDVYIMNQDDDKVFSVGFDKHFLLSEKPTLSARQEFVISLDKEGFYQIAHGHDLFLQYDSFVNGLRIDKFDKSKNIGFLLYQDDVALPFPSEIDDKVESSYRKRRPRRFRDDEFKKANESLFGNKAAEQYQNLKYFTSEKISRSDLFEDRSLNPADIHANAHNAAVNVYRNDYKSIEENLGLTLVYKKTKKFFVMLKSE
ncbi:hypothetical protein TUBRATIS_007130 [Tubulinosema ratisbonensis]|uniref:Uncharacterized protein n=1 Tax=Tubulinosema ratisbonensis TaxID=291195 RepID=A0A437ANK6_9MICR|nr:hypothetical protein TUBRATIS_007130 [Tubulinosema ratisbonensis]